MKWKTQYERAHEAAKLVMRQHDFVQRWFEANPVREGLMQGMLYIAWKRGYDAARRDARKGGAR